MRLKGRKEEVGVVSSRSEDEKSGREFKEKREMSVVSYWVMKKCKKKKSS